MAIACSPAVSHKFSVRPGDVRDAYVFSCHHQVQDVGGIEAERDVVAVLRGKALAVVRLGLLAEERLCA